MEQKISVLTSSQVVYLEQELQEMKVNNKNDEGSPSNLRHHDEYDPDRKKQCNHNDAKFGRVITSCTNRTRKEGRV